MPTPRMLPFALMYMVQIALQWLADQMLMILWCTLARCASHLCGMLLVVMAVQHIRL